MDQKVSEPTLDAMGIRTKQGGGPRCGWPLSLPLLDVSKSPPLLPNMSRSEAELLFGEAADKASASASKRTDYLAAGEAAGRKLTKSWQLGVSAIGEAHLHKLPSR